MISGRRRLPPCCNPSDVGGLDSADQSALGRTQQSQVEVITIVSVKGGEVFAGTGRRRGVVFVRSSVVIVTLLAFAFATSVLASAAGVNSPDVLMEKMRAAWDGIEEYQENMEIRTLQSDGSFKVEKLIYSFKKPDHIRLDMEMPHPGAVAIYPDRDGKVVVRRSATSRFLILHLQPDSFLLGGRPEHRIDRSDMGLLIQNIGRSLTDERRGPIDVFEKDGVVWIRVLAADHFRSGTVTLYEFRIDPKVWLPVGVTESTADGRLVRVTDHQNLRLNPRLSDSFFDPDSPQGIGGEKNGN
jgi:outer membrane lipoprotein-sorting protein